MEVTGWGAAGGGEGGGGAGAGLWGGMVQSPA